MFGYTVAKKIIVYTNSCISVALDVDNKVALLFAMLLLGKDLDLFPLKGLPPSIFFRSK